MPKQSKQPPSKSKDIFNLSPLTAFPFKLSYMGNTKSTAQLDTPRATDISQPPLYRFAK